MEILQKRQFSYSTLKLLHLVPVTILARARPESWEAESSWKCDVNRVQANNWTGTGDAGDSWERLIREEKKNPQYLSFEKSRIFRKEGNRLANQRRGQPMARQRVGLSDLWADGHSRLPAVIKRCLKVGK